MKITDPSYNYNDYSNQYAAQLRAEPEIATFIDSALGDAYSVLNVGAGAGSYESDGSSEAFLYKSVRAGMSSWGFILEVQQKNIVAQQYKQFLECYTTIIKG